MQLIGPWVGGVPLNSLKTHSSGFRVQGLGSFWAQRPCRERILGFLANLWLVTSITVIASLYFVRVGAGIPTPVVTLTTSCNYSKKYASTSCMVVVEHN